MSTRFLCTRWGRLLLGGLVLLAIPLSCSREYDGSGPVYDTTRNPEGFPAPAVALLQDIETGRIRTYDSIAERFGDLYTTHPTLLGNPGWSGVVERLGVRLARRADQLVRDGLLQYAEAADLYLLAAQTRPHDSLLAAQASLFGVWRETVADLELDLSQLTIDGRDNAATARKLEFITRFALESGRHFRFAVQYLVGALFEQAVIDSLNADGSGAGLSPADRALRAALRLGKPLTDAPIARFADRDIDLVAVRVTPAADSFCIETYFLPHVRVDTDLGIACWLETPDSLRAMAEQPRFPYDFQPLLPTSSWEPGWVVIGCQRVAFDYPVSAVLIGLNENRGGQVTPVPLSDSGYLQRIPIPGDAVRL